MDSNCKSHIELINQQIKELMGAYRDAIKHLDISESEFWVWYTLTSMNGHYTQQDICNMWSLPKQTVNTVMSHMRRKKYAYLEAVPGRRTKKTIYLTEEGKKRGLAIVSLITSAEESVYGSIPPEEFEQVTGTFGKYINVLRKELSERVARLTARKSQKTRKEGNLL